MAIHGSLEFQSSWKNPPEAYQKPSLERGPMVVSQKNVCQWPNCHETEVFVKATAAHGLVSRATMLISKDLTQEGRGSVQPQGPVSAFKLVLLGK